MLHCTLEYGSDVLQCTFACTGVLIHLLQSVGIQAIIIGQYATSFTSGIHGVRNRILPLWMLFER